MTFQQSKGIDLRAGVLLLVILTITTLGCAVRKTNKPSSAFLDHHYVQLQAGWRVRVVTPVLKSGGFKVQIEEKKISDGEVLVKTSDDFIGYEEDYYSVGARDEGGIRVRFESAELVQFKSAELRDHSGRRSTKSSPAVLLFEIPENIHFLRLLFLTRLNPTEHDAVIVGAPSLAELNSLTTSIESAPSDACNSISGAFCSWVPEGVSVQPEKRNPDGKGWIPAV